MNRQKSVGLRIKQARESLNMSQNELGRMYGCSDAHISRIEGGIVKLGIADIERFASILGKSLDWFLSDKVQSQPRPLQAIISEFQQASERLEIAQVPITGNVPAGYPSMEEEDFEGYISVCREELATVKDTNKLYALRVNGDSLQGDGIYSGDFVIIEPSPEVVDGKIYVVMLDNEVVTRHLYRHGNKLKLVSSNGNYKVMEVDEVEIQGRVVLSGRWKKH